MFYCFQTSWLGNWDTLSAFQSNSQPVSCVVSHGCLFHYKISSFFSPFPGAFCPWGRDSGTDCVQWWAGPSLTAGCLHSGWHLLHLGGHLGAHARLHPSCGSYAGMCGSEPIPFWHLENQTIFFFFFEIKASYQSVFFFLRLKPIISQVIWLENSKQLLLTLSCARCWSGALCCSLVWCANVIIKRMLRLWILKYCLLHSRWTR